MAKKSRGVSPLTILLFPFFMVIVVTLLCASVHVYRTGEPVAHIIPYALLFTGFRNATAAAWKTFGAPLDKSKVLEPEPIPEMPASEYTYEKFRALTQDFSVPAVVRGLFLDVPALEKWKENGYLSSHIGQFEVPVIRNAKYGNPQNNRSQEPIGPALEKIIAGTDTDFSYLFFPMKSRPTEGHYASGNEAYARLSEACNKLAIDDLWIHKKIWPRFGTDYHTEYAGTQLIIGNGLESLEATTGTAWHCAMGSNFFVQVAGTKRWYFSHPKYSWMFKPLRNGAVAFMIGPNVLQDSFKYIPIRWADIRTGDMLFNPGFQWHSIQNHPGLSMATPIRERNVTQSIRNNFIFSAITGSNKFFESWGFDVGGYPKQVSREHD